MSEPFVWKERDIVTMGDLGEVLVGLESPEEAHEFMEMYRKRTPHAAQNVGYIAGYYDIDTAQRILSWCETAHPVFGTHIPTPEEAFAAGQQLGLMMKDGQT